MNAALSKINVVSVAKFAVTFFVGIGTKSIVDSFIEGNTQEPETRMQKVSSKAAGTVIALMAVERTKAWTDGMIDKIADGVKKELVEAEAKNTQS